MSTKPDCRYGYSATQLEALLGDRLDDFYRWMCGQTVSICDGREYDYDARDYRDTGCGPHGTVVYTSDVRQFLAGRAPLDG